MKTFTDTAGRTWQISLTVAAAKRVRDLAEVDLLTILDGQLLQRLGRDPILLVDVLWAICLPQATAANISAEQFGESLAGDVIELATDAFLAEVIDFFPRGNREVLRAALARQTEVNSQAASAIQERINGPTVDLVLANNLKELDARLARLAAGGTGSLDWPESSAAPPTN